MVVGSTYLRRIIKALLPAILLGVVLVPLVSHGASARAAALPSATQLMNWFPEPEHGGFYTAQAENLYQKYGANIKISPFSYAYKGLDAVKEVALGKLTFAMTNADDLYSARALGLPVVAVFATMQNDLQCFMWHANDMTIPVNSKDPLAHLSNHTVIYSFGATFWSYMSAKYHYTNVKTLNYDFTLRNFAAMPNAVNQGYISEEPYTAEHNKPAIPVHAALIATTGYNPYYQVIVTSESEIKNHPDVVRAYVAATVAGWNMYYSSKAETEKINAYMRNDPTAKSFPLTPAAMDYAVKASQPIVTGGDAKTHGIGYMSLARWTTLKQQLVSVGLKVGKVDPSAAFTDQFLPKM